MRLWLQVSNIRLWPSPRVDIGATNEPKPSDKRPTYRPKIDSACRSILARNCLWCAMPSLGGRDESHGSDDEVSETDESAFRELYREEAPALVRFFRRKVRSHDEAEDLAQETLARFLRASPVTAIQTPQAYLKRIATNLLRDRAERGSTRLAEMSVPLNEGLDQPGICDPYRELVGRQELAHFEQVLLQLKPRTLEIFLLSRVDGYTYKEIASRLGMTLFGVKWHMLKAISHIDQHRRNR